MSKKQYSWVRVLINGAYVRREPEMLTCDTQKGAASTSKGKQLLPHYSTLFRNIRARALDNLAVESAISEVTFSVDKLGQLHWIAWILELLVSISPWCYH